jgi:hypothetical protein
MNWKTIPKFPQIYYRINISWDFLEDQLNKFVNEYKLDLNPDFQRGHVWTEEQQIKFVEYAVSEPQSGLEIYFNHPGWMSSYKGDFVLVDGKQRLEAARRFLNNEIPAYGYYRKEFRGQDTIPSSIQFFFNIAKLQTRKDVLKWYLDFNSGGTPHSKEELERVKQLLDGN